MPFWGRTVMILVGTSNTLKAPSFAERPATSLVIVPSRNLASTTMRRSAVFTALLAVAAVASAERSYHDEARS